MGCAASSKFQYGGHPDERGRLPELREIAQKFQQELFPDLLKCFDDLHTCLGEACSSLDTVRDIVDRYFGREEAGRRGVGVPVDNMNDSRQLVVVGGDTFRHMNMKNLHAFIDKLKQQMREQELVTELERAMEELKRVMQKLEQRNSEIDKSLRSIKRSHKIWNAVSIAVHIGVLVCWVVLVALGAVPPAGIAALTSAGPVMKAFEPCVKFMWDQREKALQEEKQMVEEMLVERISVHELQSLRLLVQNLRREYAALAGHMKFIFDCQDDEKAFEFGMEASKKKTDGGKLIRADINSWSNRVDVCERHLREAEAKFRKIYSKLSDSFDARNQASR